MAEDDLRRPTENRDPITGAPGAHPIGVGVGAAAGGIAAGAAAGTLAAGPIGTVVGAAVGAFVGGLGGKAIAEHYDPTIEEEHWRAAYDKEPYYKSGVGYEDYAPAYRLGGEAYAIYGDVPFENFEDDLATQYERTRGTSSLEWADAKAASRAAWSRVRGERT
jgi:hypothetical protein